MESQKTNLSLELHQCFEHGGKTYTVEHPKDTKSCHGCAFCEKYGNRCTLDNMSSDVPNCFGLNRHDGMDVIFVEVPDQIAMSKRDRAIEDFAKGLATKRYDTTNYIGQIKFDCFVEGFIAGANINFDEQEF